VSGIATLHHTAEPDLSAFSHAGLNYEHLFVGTPDARNFFAPRTGDFEIHATRDGAVFARPASESPWGVPATLTYRLVAPHYVDFTFTASLPAWVGLPAGFMFASYMQVTRDPELHFRVGDQWGTSSPVPGEVGESYALEGAPPFPFNDERLAVNLGTNSPSPTLPLFYGVVDGCPDGVVGPASRQAMVYVMMFESGVEVRGTVMRWSPNRPAWDFVFVARRHGTVCCRGRVIWKPFVSADDVLAEFESWSGEK